MFQDLERMFLFILLILSHYLITVILARGKRVYNNNFIDLSNMVAVVTGGCKGIGFEISRNMLKSGCTVVMIQTDKASALAVIKLFKESFNISPDLIHYVQMDLDNCKSIRNGVDVITNNFKQIDFIINNAGIAVGKSPFSNDDDSLSKHFNGDTIYSVNVMGHYILTKLLMPYLRKNARVINMSSMAHFFYKPDTYFSNTYSAYSRSKLANIHFSAVLQRLFDQQGNGCVSYSCAPGIIITKLFSDLHLKYNPTLGHLIMFLAKLFGKTPDEAAQIVLFLCMADIKSLVGGSYYNNMDIGITCKLASDLKMQQKFYEEVESVYKKLKN